jgi:hypothetical protein
MLPVSAAKYLMLASELCFHSPLLHLLSLILAYTYPILRTNTKAPLCPVLTISTSFIVDLHRFFFTKLPILKHRTSLSENVEAFLILSWWLASDVLAITASENTLHACSHQKCFFTICEGLRNYLI